MPAGDEYARAMAILDKLLGVADAAREKYKETFGEPQHDDMSLDDDASNEPDAPLDPPLDVPGAYAALGIAEGATLADVREAYRALARYHHPMAQRDGVDSDAQRALDRLLEALELLEETLVPLSGSVGPVKTSQPPPRRKRATARKR